MKTQTHSDVEAGEVLLVGAGPGDPDLLTIKAVKALQRASVVLVDDLVSAEILALAPAHARLIHVGKRGGCRSTPQSFIERLMVRMARRGEIVVRLKGGDPFIFGRGGEELQTLKAAGVRVSVVNGITAGLAAANALDIALTHRAHAHGVMFITGHAKTETAGTDWVQVAACARQAHLTLVIYMGVSGAAAIQSALLQELPASTSVAVVQHASLALRQRYAVATLGQLADVLEREQLASPSIIIVGNVLRGLAQTSRIEAASACLKVAGQGRDKATM